MSAALERVSGWFEAGDLERPASGRPDSVELTRALATLGGASPPATEGSRAVLERIAEGEAEHLVFVLADGLGLELVERLPETSFLRRHVAAELRSVYPSATASAITSLATGEWPARHAVPGWWVYLPEHGLTATALPFVERFGGRPLSELGVSASVFPAPPLLPRYERRVCTFQPAPIADSAYSRYFRGGTASEGYEDLEGGVERVLAHVDAAADPSFAYFYVPSVDEASHAAGPRSDAARDAALELDRALVRLARGLAGRGRLVVSADHGQVRVRDDRKHVLAAGDPLADLLRVPPTGEPRAPHFHVRPGQADRFRSAFAERFGDRFALLTPDEAERLELYGPGPLSERTRERLGDLVAVAAADDVLLYREGERPGGAELLVGYHGGLLPDEVRVPLILA